MAKNDAIREDAPAGTEVVAEEEQQQEVFRTPREAMMDEMAAKRRQALAQEGVAIPEPEDESQQAVVDEADDANDKTGQETDVEGEETDAAGDDELAVDDQVAAQLEQSVIADNFDKVKVKAKVDGEEVEVTLDQVMRQFQKNSSADKRLAEATRLLKEAQERATASNATAEPTSTETTEVPELPAPKAKDIVAAMMEGDEEKAEQLLDQLLQGRQAPQGKQTIPSADEIARQVKQHIDVESALSTFQKDYSDIASDPYLMSIAEQKFAEHSQEGLSFSEALAKAGEATRDWVKAKTGVSTTETASTTSRAERLERKAKLDNPRAASVTAKTTESVPLTEEQIRANALAELKASRPAQA